MLRLEQDIINNMVMVDFYFYSESLKFSYIDGLMGIVATEKRKKESFSIKEFAKDYWILSTGYQNSDDINSQLNKIMSLISSKKVAINSICQQCNAMCGFCIVIKRHNDIIPAVYYEREFIKFLADINADINMDFV